MPFVKRAFALLVFPLAAPPLLAAALPSSWVPLGPFGGYINHITADPANPGVLYGVTAQGAFRTADAGGSWSLILPGLLSGGRIAVDPIHPSTLYLSGDFGDRVVLKSVDAGAHWFPADSGLPPVYTALAVDPARPRRLYAASSTGFWRSVDAGASWQRMGQGVLPGSTLVAQGVAASSHPAGKVLAATVRGVYRSTDGGATWTPVAGLPRTYTQAVAFAPSDPRIAYAYFDRSGPPSSGGLYRSTDGGVSWRRVLAAQPSTALEISISSASPGLVYVRFGDGGVLRSTNGGDRWTRLPAPPVNSLAADPFSVSTVYSGLVTEQNLGGVWRSTNQGNTWEPRSRGMIGVSTSSLAIDPENPLRLRVNALSSLLRTLNGGTRWAGIRTPTGEQGVLRVAAGPGGVTYALTLKNPSPFDLPVYSLWKTANDGASWTRLLGPSTTLYDFRTDPSHPAILYALEFSVGPLGSSPYVQRSTDGGAHWEEARPAAALTCGLGDLEAAPSNPAVVYLGGCKDEDAFAVLRSGDGGATFTDVSAGLASPEVQALAVDPRDPDTVWAGTGNVLREKPGDGVWKTTNGGASWTRAGSELAGLTLTDLLAPDIPGRVYAATLDGRVFRSDDGGATWDDWTDGLPHLWRIFALEAAPDDPRRIYAVTSNGVWILTEAD